MIVIAGASNAVNLSDGLDGLAGGLSLIAFSAFALIAFVTGIPAMNTVSGVFIPGTAEVAVICSAAVGACLGFCGLIARRPKYSWATPARWRWALF